MKPPHPLYGLSADRSDVGRARWLEALRDQSASPRLIARALADLRSPQRVTLDEIDLAVATFCAAIRHLVWRETRRLYAEQKLSSPARRNPPPRRRAPGE